MRFLHTADLHIGKKIKELSLLEDQEYILNQIIDISIKEEARAIIVAGDLYDRTIPQGQAINLLDDFLTELVSLNKIVFIISGNHDSNQRLAFASRILSKNQVYIVTSFEGKLEKITLEDEKGKVNVFCLPFLRPQVIREHYNDENVKSYQDAVKKVLEETKKSGLIDTNDRNILIAHHFVMGSLEPTLSDSESTFIGSLENIDYKVFDDFDYVALGHLHCGQSVGRKEVRYSGSPLKYSFSEVNHNKSVAIIDITNEDVSIRAVPLHALRDMRKIKGRLKDIIDNYDPEAKDDFIHATLTDKEELYEPFAKLRAYYPNLLHIEQIKGEDEKRTDPEARYRDINKDPIGIFAEFYELMKDEAFNQAKRQLLEDILREENLGEVRG